jgi:hypothetical protein
MTSISFTVNARSVEVVAHGDTPLLDVLCDHLGFAGTRFGCGLDARLGSARQAQSGELRPARGLLWTRSARAG